MITKLQIIVLEYLCRKLVVQGYNHKNNIKKYYQIMREAARNEFWEDNETTLDSFLQECFDSSKINKSYELDCNGERLPLIPLSGENVKDTLFREFGWLLKPIMEQTKSFENALDKLNWKIVTKYK